MRLNYLIKGGGDGALHFKQPEIQAVGNGGRAVKQPVVTWRNGLDPASGIEIQADNVKLFALDLYAPFYSAFQIDFQYKLAALSFVIKIIGSICTGIEIAVKIDNGYLLPFLSRSPA